MTYLNYESLSVAFIPQYSSELAPIERYFSKLKQDAIQKSKGEKVNWKKAESNKLIRSSMLNIPPEIVRRIWRSLTKEINTLLDSCKVFKLINFFVPILYTGFQY